MASIRQRGKKKIYYAFFRNANGQQVERSTKTTDKKRAQDLADEYEKATRPGTAQTTFENFRKVVAELYKKTVGKEMPSMTVKGFFEHWLSMRKNEISEDSYSFYKAGSERFINFLGKERSNNDLLFISKTDIVSFRDSERKRITATSTNHLLKLVRMIFRQARVDGWIITDPAEDVKLVKAVASEMVDKRPFTVEELKVLLTTLEDLAKGKNKELMEEWKAMVIRGYYTGQRLLDVALMIAESEDPLLGQTTFRTGKTDSRVIIEMHPAYVDWVLKQPSFENPKQPLHKNCFKVVNSRKKSRTSTLSNQFAKILAKAGLRPKTTQKKKPNGNGRNAKRDGNSLSYHSLRHSFVSHLADAGVSRSIVQDLVGHESAQINARYTKLDAKTKREAMAKLPDIIKS